MNADILPPPLLTAWRMALEHWVLSGAVLGWLAVVHLLRAR